MEESPGIVPSGSRKSAYDDFRTSVETERDKYELILLLVDSEEAVAGGRTPWEHLKAIDKWDKPEQADDRSAHLMVRCMESWFLADKDVLADYFGQGFLKNSLPGQTNVEQISKGDVLAALEHAARPTTKKHYHKTAHGYELLGLIDPAKVRAASQHAGVLNDLMAEA